MAPNLKAAQARSDNLAKARRASKVILEEVPDPAREWLPPIDKEAEAAHLDWSDFEDDVAVKAENAKRKTKRKHRYTKNAASTV
ncbi:hypothetical protein BC835DRAFT_1415800 [Cytidiella melzeri]|nr:hypothetical protein BC835DRAFT_1415800 [Cytidiella melzeri]